MDGSSRVLLCAEEEKNSDVQEEVEKQVSEEEGVDEEKEWKELQESVKRDKSH